MFQIIKNKGIKFFLKRLSAKIFDYQRNKLVEFQSNLRPAYSNIYNENQKINYLYDANKIHFSNLKINEIINFAAQIIEHKFNLLGSGLQKVAYDIDYNGFQGKRYDNKIWFKNITELLEKSVNIKNFEVTKLLFDKISSDYIPIDWQRDFKSGYRWDSNKFYTKISYGNVEGVDVKVPWELGRLAHLQILFYAFQISKDTKYLIEYQNQILDFISFNPPGFGVQWKTTMDVSLRAVNLTSVHSLFKSLSTDFDEKFEIALLNYLYSHLIHILNNLEWSSGMRANHYFANLCGLLYLTLFLPNDKITSFAFNFAVNELILETFHQFNDDGGNFEASLPYHNFTSEMLFQTILLLKNQPIDKIKKLSELYDKTTANNFQINDNLNYRINNLHENLKIDNSTITFPENFVKRMNSIADFTINTLTPNLTDYLLGDNDDGSFFRFIPHFSNDFEIHANNRSELLKIASYLSGINSKRDYHFYKNFGIYINRVNNYEICIRCGSLGQNGKGGHAHNDQLSFELYAGNDFLICDSGTYTYTASPELRNKFRATESHNTLAAAEMEQNPLSKGKGGNLFWLEDKTKSKVLNFGKDFFVGEHYGFGNPHRRNFKFFKEEIHIIDYCNLQKKKKILIHLTNEAEILENQNNIVKVKSGKSIFSVICDDNSLKIENYEYSPSYGVKYSANVIVIESEKNEIFWKIKLS